MTLKDWGYWVSNFLARTVELRVSNGFILFLKAFNKRFAGVHGLHILNLGFRCRVQCHKGLGSGGQDVEVCLRASEACCRVHSEVAQRARTPKFRVKGLLG